MCIGTMIHILKTISLNLFVVCLCLLHTSLIKNNFTPFNESYWMTLYCGVDTKYFFFAFIMANLLHSLLYDNAVIALAVCYFRCYFLVLTMLYCVCTIAM